MQISTAGCNYAAGGFKQKFLINARKTRSFRGLSRISAHGNSLTAELRATNMHNLGIMYVYDFISCRFFLIRHWIQM